MNEYYIETLNALQEDAAEMLSAEESLKYLYCLTPGNPDCGMLTDEMRDAFKSLYDAAESFIRAYQYYTSKSAEGSTELPKPAEKFFIY